MRRTWGLTALALACAVCCGACTAGDGEQASDAGTQARESYISESVEVETNGSDGVNAGIVITDVRVYSSGIAISGSCEIDPLPGSLPSIEYTSDNSLGPMGTTPVDSDGKFTAGFEFPAAHIAPAAPPYDIASIGGQFVYLDLHKGLWADRDGGEFRQITGWYR